MRYPSRGVRRDEVAVENEQLRKENARSRRRLDQSQTILKIQKSLRGPGHPLGSAAERRRHMIRAVKHVAPTVGLASACRALGVARGSLYRHRKPHPTCPGRSVRSLPHALSPEERVRVLDILHEDRSVDLAPATVYAMLHEEGRYVCSVRTMYRLLHDAHEVRERRD